VERGSSLRSALSKHPKVFNQFWVSLVEVGEASGTMPKILDKLAFYLEQQASFQSSIISAIIYPCILFSVALLAILVFAVFVGPKFEQVFTSMKVPLPMITSTLLVIFRFIKTHLLLLFLAFAILIFFLKQYTKTYFGKLLAERFCFSFPTLGYIYKLIIVERFSSQLALLVDSGVPILHALDISQRLVNNHTCAIIIGEVKEGVRQGEMLVRPMEKSGFFPPMATQMIAGGEESGELSKMLKHVSIFYQKTVETFMKRFGTIIEPVMLIFMAVVVGTIVAAMFMPMFNLATLGTSGFNN
jgi:type IV pilus assembly protein PilC